MSRPDFYIIEMHPEVIAEMQLTPKEKWKIWYRGERMRRKGKIEPSFVHGEIGAVQGFKFITKEKSDAS